MLRLRSFLLLAAFFQTAAAAETFGLRRSGKLLWRGGNPSIGKEGSKKARIASLGRYNAPQLMSAGPTFDPDAAPDNPVVASSSTKAIWDDTNGGSILVSKDTGAHVYAEPIITGAYTVDHLDLEDHQKDNNATLLLPRRDNPLRAGVGICSRDCCAPYFAMTGKKDSVDEAVALSSDPQQAQLLETYSKEGNTAGVAALLQRWEAALCKLTATTAEAKAKAAEAAKVKDREAAAQAEAKEREARAQAEAKEREARAQAETEERKAIAQAKAEERAGKTAKARAEAEEKNAIAQAEAEEKEAKNKAEAEEQEQKQKAEAEEQEQKQKAEADEQEQKQKAEAEEMEEKQKEKGKAEAEEEKDNKKGKAKAEEKEEKDQKKGKGGAVGTEEGKADQAGQAGTDGSKDKGKGMSTTQKVVLAAAVTVGTVGLGMGATWLARL